MAHRSISAEALLFDFDGTLIDSSAFYDDVWSRWAHARALNPAPILAVHHGRRFADTLAVAGYGHVPVDEAHRELMALSRATTAGLALVPGVRELLSSLPANRWGIVTSSSTELVTNWLRHFDLPMPGALVTAEMVIQGKPAPDCYVLGAQRLAVQPERCVVFEDAPAGIEAGRAAGAHVVALSTTHRGRLPAGLPIIEDFACVQVTQREGGLTLAY